MSLEARSGMMTCTGKSACLNLPNLAATIPTAMDGCRDFPTDDQPGKSPARWVGWGSVESCSTRTISITWNVCTGFHRSCQDTQLNLTGHPVGIVCNYAGSWGQKTHRSRVEAILLFPFTGSSRPFRCVPFQFPIGGARNGTGNLDLPLGFHAMELATIFVCGRATQHQSSHWVGEPARSMSDASR